MQRQEVSTISLTEFVAAYHPQLSAIHISMGPESVTNLYGNCTYWRVYERQLLGDFVPFVQRAPNDALEAAAEDIVYTYVQQMDECLRDFIAVAGEGTHVGALCRLHAAWRDAALANAAEVTKELRNLVETELTFVPGYATATKGEDRIDELFLSCIGEDEPHPPAAAVRASTPPPVNQARQWHFVSAPIVPYPSFGGGGDPYETIHGP